MRWLVLYRESATSQNYTFTRDLHEEHVGLMVDILVLDHNVVQSAGVRDQQLLGLRSSS